MSEPAETQAEQAVKPRDWLSFSSAIGVVAATSILYYSGWLYTSVWYSYFGIDLASINLPPQTILVNGVPSIFAMLLLTMLVILVLGFIGRANAHYANSKYRLPLFFFVTFVLTTLASAWVAFMLTGVTLSEWFSKPAGEFLHPRPITVLLLISAVSPVIAVLAQIPLILFVEVFPRLFSPGSRTPLNFQKEVLEILDAGRKIPQFWIGVILLIYLFVSVIVSNVLGEIDAQRGAHLMAGDWNIPQAQLYSPDPLPILSQVQQNSAGSQSYVYGPLGLLYADNFNYYFVAWKTTRYYPTNPRLWIVPRSENYFLEVQPVVTDIFTQRIK